MSEEELYNHIVEKLSNGDFLQLNGKAINLSELNEYINAQQQEIERLNNIIKEVREYINNEYDTEPKELYGLVSADDILKILDKENK